MVSIKRGEPPERPKTSGIAPLPAHRAGLQLPRGARRNELSSGCMRLILYVLLLVDGVQVATAFAALRRSWLSSRAAAPSLARYSLAHAMLMIGGASVLALPVLLGLFTVISSTAALIIALVLEVVGLLVSRPSIKRLDAAHQARRPGAAH